MNSRQKANSIFSRTGSGEVGFWTGAPHEKTKEIYLHKLGLQNMEELFKYLGDDCRFLPADSAYMHPEGWPAFDPSGGKQRGSLSGAGCLADCESFQEIEDFPWPNPDYLDFTAILDEIRLVPDKMVLTGFWSPFFHIVSDYLGMENYFIKMHTEPEIVEAITEHVLDFLEAANDRFFRAAGDDVDTFFFGNDFGTQMDLLVSPDLFKRFILPGMKRLINIAKKHKKKVMLHSCGSIYRVIPMLIDAGIDVLHPLQAKAANMDAVTLAREFKNDLAFVGGIDTQELLIYAKPDQIKDEVRRIRDILGPNLIISPSHEAILPNVPVENIIAMAEAAREI